MLKSPCLMATSTSKLEAWGSRLSWPWIVSWFYMQEASETLTERPMAMMFWAFPRSIKLSFVVPAPCLFVYPKI